jgi:hypothetical protein
MPRAAAFVQDGGGGVRTPHDPAARLAGLSGAFRRALNLHPPHSLPPMLLARPATERPRPCGDVVVERHASRGRCTGGAYLQWHALRRFPILRISLGWSDHMRMLGQNIHPPRSKFRDTYACNQIEPAFTDFKIGCGGSSTVSLIPPQLSRAPGINPERLEFITYMFYRNKGTAPEMASHQEKCRPSVDPVAHSTVPQGLRALHRSVYSAPDFLEARVAVRG